MEKNHFFRWIHVKRMTALFGQSVEFVDVKTWWCAKQSLGFKKLKTGFVQLGRNPVWVIQTRTLVLYREIICLP